MLERLFVYGSLAPGMTNAHVLAEIPGAWEPASVEGTLRSEGWGSELGFPGLELGVGDKRVPGLLFSSSALSPHWRQLDEFEGEDYERVLTTVRLEDGREVKANVYVLNVSQ